MNTPIIDITSFCKDLYSKAINEGLLTNNKVIKDWWSYLIHKKILFYCPITEFKVAIRRKHNLFDIKALLFSCYKTNLDLTKMIRLNQNNLASDRYKIEGQQFLLCSSTVFNNTRLIIKNKKENDLEKENELISIWDSLLIKSWPRKELLTIYPEHINTKFTTKALQQHLIKLTCLKLQQLQIEVIQKDYFGRVTKVDSIHNHYTNCQVFPFTKLLNYHTAKQKVLNTTEIWDEFEYTIAFLLENNFNDSEVVKDYDLTISELIDTITEDTDAIQELDAEGIETALENYELINNTIDGNFKKEINGKFRWGNNVFEDLEEYEEVLDAVIKGDFALANRLVIEVMSEE